MGKKQYQASTIAGITAAPKAERTLSQCESLFGDMERRRMEGSTVLFLLPHYCYWKGDTALTEVLRHNAEGKGGIGIYGMLGESPGGSIPFHFCLERRISSLRDERIYRVLMRSIHLFLDRPPPSMHHAPLPRTAGNEKQHGRAL